MDFKKAFAITQMADQYDDDDSSWAPYGSSNYQYSEYDDFGATQHAEYGNFNYEENRRKKHLQERKKDGEFCVKCQEFYPFAEPNQDNLTLICYSCKLFEKMSK